MQKRKTHEKITTLLGPDASIDGNLEFGGAVRVDGQMKGSISSKAGAVILGEKAFVNAKIEVDVAIVMGEVRGTITARDRIEICSSGRVIGDINAPVVSIEQGGLFHGICSMKVRALPEKKYPETSSQKGDENRSEPVMIWKR